MQLFKRRDFSTFITDTFNFFKENGSHFFKNYFVLNGVFVIFTLSKILLLESSNFSINVFFAYLSYFFGILVWIVTTAYLIVYSKKKDEFDYRDVLQFIKSKSNKIIWFMLMSIILFIPVIVIFYLSIIISVITIIGPIIVIAAFFTWYSLIFYEYLNSEKKLSECFKYGYKLLTNNFWSITISVALVYFIFIVLYFFIFSLLGVFNSVFDLNNFSFNKINYFTNVSSTKVLVVQTFLSVFSVLIQVLQGIIYFSQKEAVENIETSNNINKIGK